MKRQNIRSLVLLISFLLFPITFYYFSPYVIIMGAMEGIITGSFLLFITLALAAIFFGRAFCAYVCPAGALQEALEKVNGKPAKIGWRKYIKYAIWIIWIIILLLLFVTSGGVKKVEPAFMTNRGISVSEIGCYIIYYMVLFLIVITNLLGGRRAFCHYFCWMAPFMVIGIKVRKLLHLPGLYLEADKDACVGCKQCTKNCPMSLQVEESVKGGNLPCTDCILCGKCVDACPKHAITYKFKRR